MKVENTQEFVHELLNTSNLRRILRQRIPQIDRIETLDSLIDLKLTRANIGQQNPIQVLLYEAIASSELYRDLNSKLLEIAEGAEILELGTKNKGKPDEYQALRLGVSENIIQVNLRIYNPNYKRQS